MANEKILAILIATSCPDFLSYNLSTPWAHYGYGFDANHVASFVNINNKNSIFLTSIRQKSWQRVCLSVKAMTNIKVGPFYVCVCFFNLLAWYSANLWRRGRRWDRDAINMESTCGHCKIICALYSTYKCWTLEITIFYDIWSCRMTTVKGYWVAAVVLQWERYNTGIIRC
jgi:hypothetical protein